MARQTRKYRYDFRGHLEFPATASGVGTPFVKAVTAAAGSPTVGGANGGGVELALEATSEVQNVCMYMGDVLPFDIDEIVGFEIIAKATASLNAATSIAFGLASERNDAIDSIAEAALFRCIGDNDVVVETDDGTNNNDDVSTGLTLKDTWKRFAINFAERVSTMEPPTLSVGRPSNIGFYGANDNGSLRRVASGTRFDMSNYSSGLQLFAQIQKTAATAADKLTILEACVEVNLPKYA